MTERKRFKFQSSSKIAKSIHLSAYDDIISFFSKDLDGSPRCFKITLTNLLRVKDLLKFQNELRELQKSEFFSNDTSFEDSYHSTPDYYDKPLQILLKCLREASHVELDFLCRLLASYFKDYGDTGLLKIPFDELLDIIEQNANLNSKPIFTFILTYFKSHTLYILKNIHEILKEFLPWLNSRNALIKRLSMECLGMLLRRAPIDTIKQVIRLCIYTDGAEKIVFTIIQNVDGNFTTKIHSLFTFLFEDLIPNNMENVSKIVENIRNTIHTMSSHSKDNKVDLSWLKDSYEHNIVKLAETKCKIEFKALSVVLELTLEMLITFDQNKFTSVKNYPLIARGDYFNDLLVYFIVPLLKFSNKSGKVNLFEDLCSYLLRAVRSDTEATQVLESDFELFLTNIDHNLVCMNNINSFLSLFEWRLKTNDLSQVSHILLVFANIIEHRDIFHPLIVNQLILNRVLSFVSNILADIESSMEMGSFLNLFSIMCGLSSINKVRLKLKANRIENEHLFHRVLSQVLRGLERAYDSRVLLRIYTITIGLLSDRNDVWIEKLVSTANRLNLYHNYFLVEFLVLNYSEALKPTVYKVLDNLPSENGLLRLNAIKLVQMYYSKNNRHTECLNSLLEIESTPNDVESSRKKCMTMSRAVNSIDFGSINEEDSKILLCLVKKVLLSQYFVKFSPLWEGAYTANMALISKLKPHEKGLGDTWQLYFNQLRALAISDEWPLLNQTIESSLNYQSFEKTDLVTIQFQLLRVISEIISTVKQRDSKVEELVDYTLDQFRNNTDYVKNSICALSGIIMKFNVQKYRDELFDLCVTAGLKSSDTKVRESSLHIISKRHKIDTKRLGEMCTANFQQISALTKSYVYADMECETLEDKMTLNMSIGIEIRLLVPRIYQHSNVAHGNTIVDYFLNFDPKYVSLMLIELLPNEYASLFCFDSIASNEKAKSTTLANNTPDPFMAMFKTMKFDEAPYTLHLPNVLTTLNLIIRRLINHLRPQSLQIMDFCCTLLDTHRAFPAEDSNIIVDRTFRIMIELVGIFKTTHFIETLERHSEVIVELTKTVGIEFILTCTADAENIEHFCTRVVNSLFPSVFDVKLTQKHITLADNIFTTYPRYVKKHDLSLNTEMVNLMTISSETLLNSMCAHSNYNCSLISSIVELDLGDEVNRKALSIFLASLPTRASMIKSVNAKNEVDLWKKILGSLDKCLYLIDSSTLDSVNKIWDFVDDILSLVLDTKCRRLACELLKKLPSTDEDVTYTGKRLCSMNGSSMELKLDLDLNVEIISDVVQDLDTRRLNFRCINTLLTHSIFLLCNHHRDPGVRRCVAELSFKVMEITKERLIDGPTVAADGPLTHSGTRFEDPTFVLSNTLFPFIRRSLAHNGDDSMVCLCLELLEHYVRVFSAIADKSTLLANLHPDLLENPSVSACFNQMRQLQKYKRCKGVKQLQAMVEANCFTTTTLLKLIIPTALQFLIQKGVVRHIGLSDMSKQCLIMCCKLLPVPSFVKILKKILQTYSESKLQIALTVFSSITNSMMHSLREYTGAQDDFKDQLGVGLILNRLKKMSLVQGKHKQGDVPVVEVFECVGCLLQYYPDSIVSRELVKQCRILTKFLASRNRDVRRLARVSLINLAKPFKTKYIDVFIRELFTNMTKGYKCSVLIFTIYAILNKVLDDENVMASTSQTRFLYTMILDEIGRTQERDFSSSKIDEARHPKSSQLISLISQYAHPKVVESNFEFLLSLLNGKLVSHRTSELEYSDKFLRRVNELIVSATSGLILNSNVDQLELCFKIFMTALPKVRGVDKNADQFPEQVVELYRRCHQTPECTLRDRIEIAKPDPGPPEQQLPSRLNERLSIMPGASTGRSFEAALKRPGFENHIFAPLFVNSCLRLFNNVICSKSPSPDGQSDTDFESSQSVTSRDKYTLCEFSVLVSFLSEEVVLQKASCTCLLKLCKARPELIERFGHVLASSLVDRIGTLELVGSEELAKDHVLLIALFFQSRHLDILLEAWRLSRRSGRLVECLLLQIETNLGRPKLHSPLLKLLLVLMKSTLETNTYALDRASEPPAIAAPNMLNGCKHDEGSSTSPNAKTKKQELGVYFDREFYRVTYELTIRMLKGGVAARAASAAARAVGFGFILLPMDEGTRSRRFSLLLKHLNSPDPLVRTMTLKTLLVITRELPGHIVWKRYANMLTLALLPRLVAEEDPTSRKFLQILVTHIWSTGNRDHKNQLLGVVAHFVKKMERHVQLAFSFFAYLALKREQSAHELNRLNLDALTEFVERINAEHWQHCYYWLMLLEHLLDVQFDLGRPPACTIWRFVTEGGLASQHPWVLASSLRIFARVLRLRALPELLPGFGARVFALLRASLRYLGPVHACLERHAKLEAATRDVLAGCIDVLSEAQDRALERLASRLCFVLRCDLGRKSECQRRIDVLLDALAHLAAKPALYRPRQRVLLLKLIIALFRVAHAKPAGVSPKLRRPRAPDGSHAEKASAVLDRVEAAFADSPAEFLRLLSFARGYVLQSRLVKKRRVAIALVAAPRLAALRKQRRNRKKRRKFTP